MRAIVPAGQVITLLADRGFVHEHLLHYLRNQQWHFRLRLPSETLVHLEARPVSPIRDLCPPAGERRFFHEVSTLGAAVGPIRLALASLLDQPDDPWFVVSDEPTGAKKLDEYGLRFDIEESFLDEKSGVYQIHTSELATPAAMERLILILSMTTLHADLYWSGRRPSREPSLRGYPLGSWSELPENWVAMATTAISAGMADLCAFLA